VSEPSSTVASRSVELPAHLETPRRGSWLAGRVGIGVVVVLAMPLIPRIGLLIPFVPPWTWLVVYVFAVWRGMHYFHVRPTVRSSQDIQDAIVLVRDGDMPAAQQHLDTALQRASGSMVPPLATLLGGVEVELGNVERGLAILESVSDSGWLDREGQRQPRGILLGSIAVAHAELRHDAAASAALKIADAMLGTSGRGWLLAARLQVLARAGRWTEVVDRFAADLDAAEQLVPAWSVRWMRVLEGLARARLGGDYRNEAGEEIRAALADPRVRASMRRLAPRWPELHAFLAAQGFEAGGDALP
jgi:hypothetical protein